LSIVIVTFTDAAPVLHQELLPLPLLLLLLLTWNDIRRFIM
jgi:hypothetical protein